jgi:tRNA N6-adenosine threonylcarbamoyltransferase
MATILGIESSCDETAAAVVVDGFDVRSSVVASQVDLHRKYGGVVPEIASRAHIEQFDTVIEQAMDIAKVSHRDIDAIAATQKPGLIGSLLIGLTAAKTLSWFWEKPLIAIDHVHAHITSPAIDAARSIWPAVALVVSGGHTSLYAVRDFLDIELLGQTTDDAAGEAFDKVATILNLPYPGGPEIDRLAKTANPAAVRFPRSLLSRDSLDFSFSGIKTAVLYHVNGSGKTSGGIEKLTDTQIADIAASFQEAVVDVLITKVFRAVDRTGFETVALGGGVAANSRLRAKLESACRDRRIEFHVARMGYCVDNAAMIASLAEYKFRNGEFATLELDASARS